VATLLVVLSGLSDALQHRPLVAVPLLFGAGLVTSLNPCIYPMIPITAGTLAGVDAQGRSRRRTVALTLTYVTGLALFYAVLGLIAGLTGSLFGTIGSSWWARLAIGNVLLVFALAMLDVIPIRVPERLAAWAGSLGGGSYPAVFLLGATSGIVAAPCGAPAVAVFLVGQLHLRQQLGANRAPRRPELDDHRSLAHPPPEIDGVAVEILNRHRRRRLSDRNPDDVVLRREGQGNPHEHCHARSHHTCPAFTK